MADVDLREYFERASGKRKSFHGANVRFERRFVENTLKSEQAGKVVGEEMDFCVVQYPGKAEEWVLAEDKHKQEYPEAWEAHQKNLEPPIQGFPLEQWPIMPKDIYLELRSKGFKTIENLADCTDEVKRKIGCLAKWCKTAKTFLESANKGTNEIVRLTELNEKLDLRCKKLEDQLAIVLRRLEAETGNRTLQGVDGHST